MVYAQLSYTVDLGCCQEKVLPSGLTAEAHQGCLLPADALTAEPNNPFKWYVKVPACICGRHTFANVRVPATNMD